MKGLHNYLNTKADYEYIKTNEPETSWKPAWQHLLDAKDNWFELREGETVDDYPTEYVRVFLADDEKGNETTITKVYREDENCKLFRVGFSVAEVEDALE